MSNLENPNESSLSSEQIEQARHHLQKIKELRQQGENMKLEWFVGHVDKVIKIGVLKDPILGPKMSNYLYKYGEFPYIWEYVTTQLASSVRELEAGFGSRIIVDRNLKILEALGLSNSPDLRPFIDKIKAKYLPELLPAITPMIEDRGWATSHIGPDKNGNLEMYMGSSHENLWINTDLKYSRGAFNKDYGFNEHSSYGGDFWIKDRLYAATYAGTERKGLASSQDAFRIVQKDDETLITLADGVKSKLLSGPLALEACHIGMEMIKQNSELDKYRLVILGNLAKKLGEWWKSDTTQNQRQQMIDNSDPNLREIIRSKSEDNATTFAAACLNQQNGKFEIMGTGEGLYFVLRKQSKVFLKTSDYKVEDLVYYHPDHEGGRLLAGEVTGGVFSKKGKLNSGDYLVLATDGLARDNGKEKLIDQLKKGDLSQIKTSRTDDDLTFVVLKKV